MLYHFLPPEDLYVFQCVGVQDKHSTVTGRSYKLLTMRIADGPYTGNVLFRAIFDSSKARFIWDSWVDSIDNEEDLIGKHCFARVTHETYTGSTLAKVGRMIKVPDEVVRLGKYLSIEDAP